MFRAEGSGFRVYGFDGEARVIGAWEEEGTLDPRTPLNILLKTFMALPGPEMHKFRVSGLRLKAM